MENPFLILERRLAFQTMCRYFLESMNPRLEREVVVLNCILDFDQYFDSFSPLRHEAHAFVRDAEAIIDKETGGTSEYADWITRWNMAYGV